MLSTRESQPSSVLIFFYVAASNTLHVHKDFNSVADIDERARCGCEMRNFCFIIWIYISFFCIFLIASNRWGATASPTIFMQRPGTDIHRARVKWTNIYYYFFRCRFCRVQLSLSITLIFFSPILFGRTITPQHHLTCDDNACCVCIFFNFLPFLI